MHESLPSASWGVALGPGFQFVKAALGVSALYFTFKKVQHLFKFTACFYNLTFDCLELEVLRKVASSKVGGHCSFYFFKSASVQISLTIKKKVHSDSRTIKICDNLMKFLSIISYFFFLKGYS